MRQYEKLAKPDPLSDDIVSFSKILKASHNAAVSEWEGLMAECQEG